MQPCNDSHNSIPHINFSIVFISINGPNILVVATFGNADKDKALWTCLSSKERGRGKGSSQSDHTRLGGTM